MSTVKIDSSRFFGLAIVVQAGPGLTANANSYSLLTTFVAVDNIAPHFRALVRTFPGHCGGRPIKTRVNPRGIYPYLPMTATRAIVKIVRPKHPSAWHPQTTNYPRFLWATLWITMFTSCPGRANTGPKQIALQMTSRSNTAKMHAPYNPRKPMISGIPATQLPRVPLRMTLAPQHHQPIPEAA